MRQSCFTVLRLILIVFLGILGSTKADRKHFKEFILYVLRYDSLFL